MADTLKYKTYLEIAGMDAPTGMVEIEAESCWDAAQQRTIMLNNAIDARTPGLSAEYWFVLIVTGPSLFADKDGNREEIGASYYVIPRNSELTADSPMAHDDEAMQLGLIVAEEAYANIPGVRSKTFPE
jgi:hypothetical protein